MMLTRVLALALTALPFLAAANPVALGTPTDCATGDLQCCDTTETVSLPCPLFESLADIRDRQAGSPAGAALLGLLGIVVQDVNVLIGVTCSPITVIGVGTGSSCSTNTVCCSDNSNVRNHAFAFLVDQS